VPYYWSTTNSKSREIILVKILKSPISVSETDHEGAHSTANVLGEESSYDSDEEGANRATTYQNINVGMIVSAE
jgi:hypothetical protein